MVPAGKYTVGEHWLDKRRDGKSPDIWQIATYSPKSRSVVYRSTKCRDEIDARAAIHAHVESERARKPQQPDDAKVLPQLILYYDEHGRNARNAAQSASSMRAWIGFFMQDELGVHVTFAQLNAEIGNRFREWRMNPHSYSVPWKGKDYELASAGIKGESVQRNIEDFRAALNHAANKGRVPYTPKIASVRTELRSRPRDIRLTLTELGAMVGFASARLDKDGNPDPDLAMRRWLLLMIATACRPDAALAFDPVAQDKGAVIDIHPPAWPRTKKVNPIVPLIAPFRSELDAWKAAPHQGASTRRTAFRTMRAALEFADNVVPKTIRHTIATELRARGVPGAEVSGILGHPVPGMSRTSAVYAHYDPQYLGKARRVLTKIYSEVIRHSDQWIADHLRTKTGNGPIVVVDKKAKKAQKG